MTKCKDHPEAPHGFLRNASHAEDRYVCECEHWEPVTWEQRFKWLCEQSWFQDAAEHYLNLKDTEYIDKFTEAVVETVDSSLA